MIYMHNVHKAIVVVVALVVIVNIVVVVALVVVNNTLVLLDLCAFLSTINSINCTSCARKLSLACDSN